MRTTTNLISRVDSKIRRRFSCTIRGVMVKVREIIKIIEADGWYLVVTKGSHRQYKHPIKPGRITIAGHPVDDLAPGTLNSIIKQANLKE
jgi:predicted RNA binding protein YcfA (HicA-like mRNA interferase family)